MAAVLGSRRLNPTAEVNSGWWCAPSGAEGSSTLGGPQRGGACHASRSHTRLEPRGCPGVPARQPVGCGRSQHCLLPGSGRPARCISVWGCRSARPQLGGLRQQTLILSQLWGPGARNQGVSSAGSFLKLSGRVFPGSPSSWWLRESRDLRPHPSCPRVLSLCPLLFL